MYDNTVFQVEKANVSLRLDTVKALLKSVVSTTVQG